MQIETGFALGVPVDKAWPLLSDLERVAPAMPGVQVESSGADGVRATMKVKVGPVTATYRTLVSVESLDDATHTAVLKASGRETRGPGTVEALVTARLSDDNGATAVALTTDLAVTGRVAQLGGGVMSEVADRLLQQFAARLEQDLTGGGSPTPPAGSVVNGPQPQPPAAPAEPEPLDLGRIAGRAMLPSAERLALGGIVALLLLLLLRRRH
jgi:hypothetical protein